MRPSVIAIFVSSAISAAGLLASCQDTNSTAVSHSESVAVLDSKCPYKPITRTGYTDLVTFSTTEELESATTAAEPNFRRIRLGLGGSQTPGADQANAATSVAIAWQTDEGTTASTVRYGTDPDPSKWSESDVAYGIAYKIQPDKFSLSGTVQQLHEAHVCGLDPNTTYYYRVGGGPKGQEVWSKDVLSFRTVPAKGAEAEVKIAVTGDSRGQHANAWQILQERLYKRGDINLQLFSGDMVDLATNQIEYETWLSNAERDTQGKPSAFGQILTLSAMGNHDNYNIQYFATVVQPADPKLDEKYHELFFSIDAGPVHIVVLDDYALAKTSIDSSYGPMLKDWLKKDLGGLDRKAQPWVLAVHHHPEWSSSNHGEDKDVVNVRQALSPIWDEFNVDLVLTGHDHNYERSQPLRINGTQPTVGKGTTYVVCAGSGASGYSNGTGPTTATSFRYGGGSIGVYGILSATKTALSFNAYSLTASGADEVIDTVTLTK